MGPIKLTETTEKAECGDLFMDGESAAVFAAGEAELPAMIELRAREGPAAIPIRGKAMVTPRGELMPFELLCA